MKVQIRIPGTLLPLVLRNAAQEAGIIGSRMIDAFGVSDMGCVRTNNEDYYLLKPEYGLYVVADGMGGAQAGEHASKLAAETVVECIAGAEKRDSETLAQSFQEANRRVIAAASTDSALEGMGTTLVAVLEADSGLLIASVGDSRAYVHDGKQLMTVTEDQTWVQEVGKRMGMDDQVLSTHPWRHVLTMAIGVSQQLRVHSYELRPESGMLILLCSDGLHGVLTPEQIDSTLKSPQPIDEKCHQLIAAVREAGGPDNVTAVLLQAR